MAHEKVLGAPLPPENLLFEGKSYDLEWDGERRPARNSSSQAAEISPALPSADFATFLINAVKFHCGQVFYLFEDERFTQQFSQFQRDPTKTMEASRLWYIHYLLVLAFGKAFVAPSTNGRSRKPPGAELFVHAMTLMPEFSFYDADPIEEIQVLCCAALYLQCLDFRGAAYCMIGRALRKALEHGMHTKIHGRTKIDGGLVQRRRKVWWTVYVLDRQMSALMGVPLGVADEAISAELPTFVDQPQKSTAMDIQIQLSRVLALALNTVYGPALGINKRFVENTREALKALAKTTDQLNSSFGIFENGAITTISRISGYLHLLYHQCVVLITRPLLYSFLRSRLGQSIHQSLIATLQSSSVRSLLQMCVESAQQILTILLALQSHSLLESFLPFDLDATFTSGISLLIAATVDPSLVDHSHPQWLQRTHAVLDEMVSRGNRVAGMIKLELSQLQDILGRLPPLDKDGRNLRRDPRATTGRQSDHLMQDVNRVMTANVGATQSSRQIPADATSSPPCMMNPPAESSVSDEFVTEYINWQEGFPAEQLINFAESMDLSALDWLSAET
ncbi:uncharacterized protein PV06_03626 [Exophiala oligosperma]|uniref:Xylanolytic transcriptional activator regulatory domain-containing protein n=1 Tax=Exophiala oligosperma TaxID=215243 RepID=A0A0D2EB43_9EURO|nr:uncharacterized protein PV06_03626 [Exophiala oligosperma]KIW45224.1 hypothetical protein PV06_03626 [Exophiala oligosperma]